MAGTGGARPGAGRKAGGKNKATIERELATKEAAERFTKFLGADTLTLEQVSAMSEIDVMRHAMIVAAMAQNWNSAATWAKEIAPYRFAKLTATKVDASITRRGVGDLTDDELLALAGDADSESEGESEGGVTSED